MSDESRRQVVEARGSFSVDVAGAPFTVGAGDRFWSDDPLVRTHPHLFRELVVRASTPRPAATTTTTHVETASAAPGVPRKLPRARGEVGRSAPDA